MFATKSCLRMMNLGHRISRGGYLISSQDCIQSVKEIINSNIMFYYYYSVKDFKLINRWDITHCWTHDHKQLAGTKSNDFWIWNKIRFTKMLPLNILRQIDTISWYLDNFRRHPELSPNRLRKCIDRIKSPLIKQSIIIISKPTHQQGPDWSFSSLSYQFLQFNFSSRHSRV